MERADLIAVFVGWWGNEGEVNGVRGVNTTAGTCLFTRASVYTFSPCVVTGGPDDYFEYTTCGLALRCGVLARDQWVSHP